MSDAAWRKFIKILHGLEAESDLSAFLELLLTPDEREDMVKRVAIVKHLVKGDMTQRELAKHLEISIAMITRGSNALKQIDSKTKELLSSVMK